MNTVPVLSTGNADPLVKLLVDLVETGVREQFKHVMAKKDFDRDDVGAGREFVARYVEFIHYVERIYEAATNSASGHYPELGELAAATGLHRGNWQFPRLVAITQLPLGCSWEASSSIRRGPLFFSAANGKLQKVFENLNRRQLERLKSERTRSESQRAKKPGK